ncbi:MAG: D-xylose 1-dehydrogenase Gfo6 [Haloarculaceae archaeon]
MTAESAFDVFAESFDRRDWDTGPDGIVRLAIAGLGWFSRDRVLPSLGDCEYLDPTVLVSGSPEKAAEIADEIDAAGITDYEGMADGDLADEYDAVYVATPNVRHLPVVEAAAEHGKHVIVEKPLEATVDRAERLVETCADADVTLMTAYRMQTHPVLRRVRELIADGFVGDVVQVEGSFTFRMLGDGGDPDQWRLDYDFAGGGSLYDIGVYPLNTTRFLLGEDPVAVQGSLSNPDPGFEDGIDEHASFVLEFPGGAQAICRSSYGAHAGNRTEIVGTEGTIRMDNPYSDLSERTVILERDGRSARFEDLFVNELTEQFDYFAHCVLTGERPEPDGRDGLTDMAVMAAIQESDESGARVDL